MTTGSHYYVNRQIRDMELYGDVLLSLSHTIRFPHSADPADLSFLLRALADEIDARILDKPIGGRPASAGDPRAKHRALHDAARERYAAMLGERGVSVGCC